MIFIAEGFPVVSDPFITFRVHEEPEKGDCFPKQVVMQCNIQHDESIFFDVYWFIGEKEVKRNVGENSIDYASFPAELMEVEWVDGGRGGQLDTYVRFIKQNEGIHMRITFISQSRMIDFF